MRIARHLLYATDFRPASQDTEEALIRLARRLEAEVTVLHVINPLLTWPAKLADVRRQVDEVLQLIASRLEVEGIEVRDRLVRQGQQSDTIVRVASQIEADLIVIGAGELSENGDFHTGPMAEAIIQNAPVPVLAVRPGEPRLRFERLLCAVDHSDVSESALKHAIALAHIFAADLHVLTVIPDIGWLSSFLETGKLAGAVEEHEQKWEQNFANFLTRADFGDVRWHKIVRKGIPYREILDTATDLSADLLAMGCTGHSGLERILIGSTTRRILRHLPCSILTAKRIPAFEDIFGEDIRTIDLLLAEANKLLESRDYKGARDKYRQVLNKHPYLLPALEGYATAAAHLGHEQEAARYRLRAEKLREMPWAS